MVDCTSTHTSLGGELPMWGLGFLAKPGPDHREPPFVGEGGLCRQQGVDHVFGNGAVLVQQQNRVVSQGGCALHANVQRAGHAQIFTVENHLYRPVRSQVAQHLALGLRRTVVDDDDSLHLRTEAVQSVRQRLIGVIRNHNGANLAAADGIVPLPAHWASMSSVARFKISTIRCCSSRGLSHLPARACLSS